MKIINVRETQKVETPHKVDVRKLYDYDNAQAMHITLQSGETLKPHITPVDVRVGDETMTIEKDNLVESPKDIVHCLSNSSTSKARILVVKSPKPTTQTKLL